MSQSEGSMLTDKAKARLKYLSTAVAGVTALSFPILVVLAAIQAPLVDLQAVPEVWYGVYALLVAASFSYTLDVKLLKRVSGVLTNGVGSGEQ